MTPRKVVILGGGVGGVASAKMISEEARKHSVNLEVTLVTKERRHYMPPLFFDVAMGEASPEETYAPIENLSRYFGVNVLVDPVNYIDAANHTVVTGSGRKIEYDYLVVALGTTYEWGKYPGLAKAGYVKDKGFMGHCEIRYNPETGKYEWADRCYVGPISSLARLFKVGFYKSWLDSLR